MSREWLAVRQLPQLQSDYAVMIQDTVEALSSAKHKQARAVGELNTAFYRPTWRLQFLHYTTQFLTNS